MTLDGTEKQARCDPSILQDVQKRFASRFAAHLASKANRVLAPPPCYDDEFFEGLMWLDSIAGEPLRTGEVLIILADGGGHPDMKRR